MIHSLYKKLIATLKHQNDDARAAAHAKRYKQRETTQEQRWAQRSAVTLRVNLYRDDELIRHTLATNFSLNGLFLRCHQADLKVGDKLSVAIPDHGDGEEKWYPMEVRVARVADSGVGMKFHHHDSQLFSGMNKLLHAYMEQLHTAGALHGIPHKHEAA